MQRIKAVGLVALTLAGLVLSPIHGVLFGVVAWLYLSLQPKT